MRTALAILTLGLAVGVALTIDRAFRSTPQRMQVDVRLETPLPAPPPPPPPAPAEPAPEKPACATFGPSTEWLTGDCETWKPVVVRLHKGITTRPLGCFTDPAAALAFITKDLKAPLCEWLK